MMKNTHSFKNKIKKVYKGLKTAGLIGLVALSVNPPNAKAQTDQINLFERPNVLSKNYYGSGDVNNNGKVDLEDLHLIENGTQNDYADINGDGKISNQDVSILESYLGNEIPYLPGDWDKLQTRQERVDWVDKMFEIDQTDKKPYRSPKWVCKQYAIQNNLDFRGHDKEYIPEKFDTTNLGKFNLPLCFMAVYKLDGSFGHTICGIPVGDNPLDFDDWYFKEPQDDTTIYPGVKNTMGFVSMPKGSNIDIEVINYFLPDSKKDSFSSHFLLRFKNLDNLTPRLDEDSVNKNLILERSPINPVSVEKQNPTQFGLSPNHPNPFNDNTKIEYSLNEPGKVILDIFNASSGQKLETLVDTNKMAGKHIINWNTNGKYSSGIYIARLRSRNYLDTKKMTLLK